MKQTTTRENEMQSITTGTEKQNKWAEDIRHDLLNTLKDQLFEFQNHPKCPEQYKSVTLEEWLANDAPMLTELRKSLQVNNHRFWIDVVNGNTGSRAGLQNLVSHPELPQYI